MTRLLCRVEYERDSATSSDDQRANELGSRDQLPDLEAGERFPETQLASADGTQPVLRPLSISSTKSITTPIICPGVDGSGGVSSVSTSRFWSNVTFLSP